MIPTRPDLLTPEVSVLSRGTYSRMGMRLAPRPFFVFMMISGMESNSVGINGNTTSTIDPLPGVTTGSIIIPGVSSPGTGSPPSPPLPSGSGINIVSPPVTQYLVYQRRYL